MPTTLRPGLLLSITGRQKSFIQVGTSLLGVGPRREGVSKCGTCQGHDLERVGILKTLCEDRICSWYLLLSCSGLVVS